MVKGTRIPVAAVLTHLVVHSGNLYEVVGGCNLGVGGGAMPKPYPLYHPEFGPGDVATLEGLVRRTSLAHRVVQRAKLALLLHREPAVGNAEAARRLGQHPNWVCTWRKRWAEGGFSARGRHRTQRSWRPHHDRTSSAARRRLVPWCSQTSTAQRRTSRADHPRRTHSADSAVYVRRHPPQQYRCTATVCRPAKVQGCRG